MTYATGQFGRFAYGGYGFERGATYHQELNVVVGSVVGFSKKLSLFIVLSVQPTLTAVFELFKHFYRSLTVTVNKNTAFVVRSKRYIKFILSRNILPGLQRKLSLYRTLSVAKSMKPTLARIVFYFRTLEAIMEKSVLLAKIITYVKTLPVTMSKTVILKITKISKMLNAVAVSAVSILSRIVREFLYTLTDNLKRFVLNHYKKNFTLTDNKKSITLFKKEH